MALLFGCKQPSVSACLGGAGQSAIKGDALRLLQGQPSHGEQHTSTAVHCQPPRGCRAGREAPPEIFNECKSSRQRSVVSVTGMHLNFMCRWQLGKAEVP